MIFYQQGSLVVSGQQFAFMERGGWRMDKGWGNIDISPYRLDKICVLCMHVPKSKYDKEVCDIGETIIFKTRNFPSTLYMITTCLVSNNIESVDKTSDEISYFKLFHR